MIQSEIPGYFFLLEAKQTSIFTFNIQLMITFMILHVIVHLFVQSLQWNATFKPGESAMQVIKPCNLPIGYF